ncbi:MAG: hypothetical protein WDN26_20155 [Chitinophagaceae bacterium]
MYKIMMLASAVFLLAACNSADSDKTSEQQQKMRWEQKPNGQFV